MTMVSQTQREQSSHHLDAALPHSIYVGKTCLADRWSRDSLMFNRYLTFTALATAAAICTTFGQSGAVSGTVRGADGKPAQAAQIRFEGKGRSNFTTTTDAHGKYAYKGLPPGLYKVSVLINGTPKSTVTVKTAAENARVDFDLKTSPAKSARHYVWVPSRTGSHMGGGWVEVDSSGNPMAGTLNVDQGGGQAVQNMQRNMATGKLPGSGP